jgi:hypothetical protein
MQRALIAVGILGFVCAATTAQAQEDLKKVARWNGEWALDLWGKDSKGGEEWTAKGKGKQHQIGDFCVWKTTFTAPDGKDMTYLGITGYDPAKKEYFATDFHSDGFMGRSIVTFGDGSVVYDASGTTATGEKVRTRCTWTLPKDKYEGKCETLTDGEWWLSGTEKGVRVK